MSQNRSHPRFVILAAVAIFGIAGSVFAGPSHKVKRVSPPMKVGEDGTTGGPADRAVSPPDPAGVAGPANDNCSGAIPLTLNRLTKGTSVGAIDDYQSPATPACFSGIGQVPTTSPGRDVVYSFSAPADGSYSFRIVQQDPDDDIANQNAVLYTSATCPASGAVDCIQGANRATTRAFLSVTGASNNQSEEVVCLPMINGETVYIFFDDGKVGNNGSRFGLEPVVCNREAEPNNTPATATPFVCGVHGASDVAPLAHCHLGFRGGSDLLGLLNDGAVCTRSDQLDQSLPESDTRCTLSGNPCSWDTSTGIDDCPVGEGHCEQLADLDCDPHCTGGPNDGRVCNSNAFCNPGSALNATCAGSCDFDRTCVDAAGLDTGVPCTAICVGGLFAGRYCSAFSDCTGGGGTCTANAACPAGQLCTRQYNEGDPDFYSLGVVASGDRIFAGVDAKSANDYDWRMRITTTTDTLQFDDDDGVSRNGSNAPEIAGTPGTGTDTFVKVSRTLPRQSEPYELYAIVRPALSSAQLEDEAGPVGNDIYFGWPGDVVNANYVTAGGYVRGLFNGTHGGFGFDSDCFKFIVNEGDLMSWYGDGEPARSAVANTQHPAPIIYDAEPAGIQNFIFGANARKHNLTPNTTLNGLTPTVTSTFFQWRASYTGMLEVCYYDAAVALGLGTPGFGNWAGSLDVNCGPLQPAGPGTTTADISIEKTIVDGNGQTGTLLTYQITITNNGTEIAQEVLLHDALDPNLAFVSLTVDDNLNGNNVACITTDGFGFFNGLPTPGTTDAPIDCINTSMAPGTTTTYLLTVQVLSCVGAGIVIDNTASVTSVSTDPNPSNDASTASITTIEDGSCNDLFCDDNSCVLDLCTSNGVCIAGVCESVPADCDDNSVCTDDLCDPSIGCINDSSSIGDQCDDFNDCTSNGCDPITGCDFPPVLAGLLCNDGLSCTSNDSCDGEGVCAGINPCNDGNDCTDDIPDDANGCACIYVPTLPGTPCDDGDSCTGNGVSPDACDGASACVPGGAADCDDGDACTSESCDQATGCVHTAVGCDDGDTCNGTETCSPASGCVAGTPLVCTDGDACNGLETCNPASGCVGGTPLTCDDANVCNGTETCNPATGCVAGSPVVCTALDQCHNVGTCAPATGLCTNPPKTSGTACNDANACTTNDACNASGSCIGGPAPVCDDGDICTADACPGASGCATRTIDFVTTGFSSGRVDGRDLVVLADAWNSCPGNARYNAAANLDQGTSAPANCVDLSDFHLFMNSFGQSCP